MNSRLLVIGPGLNYTSTLFYSNDLIDGRISERFHLTAGPANLDRLHALVLAQTKMNSEIVLRVVTPTTAHLVDLAAIPGQKLDPRPNTIAIRLNADGLDFNPVILVAGISPQQLRRAIHRVDQNIHIAVVVV